MSLPAATKQTTEKPTTGAVMEPVNKDDQAAGTDRGVSTTCPINLSARFEPFHV